MQYWDTKDGRPSLYHHNQNATKTSLCSFESANSTEFVVKQNIYLSDIRLFLQSGEAEYKLSAYFGGISGKCKEGHVCIAPSTKSNVSLANPRK
jgi:hypothetical protein